MNELFPVLIWKTKIAEHEQIKELALQFVEEQYPKNPNTFGDAPVETQNVFTTYGQDIGFPWPEIMPNYIQPLQEMGIEYGCYGEEGLHDRIGINHAWFNAYKTGQSHDLHDHLPGQFSAIHYIKYDPEVHTPTVFLNPYRQVSQASAPPRRNLDTTKCPPMWAQRSFFPVEEGDLIVFPAFFEHCVLKQTSDEFRITMSFNFNFV